MRRLTACLGAAVVAATAAAQPAGGAAPARNAPAPAAPGPATPSLPPVSSPLPPESLAGIPAPPHELEQVTFAEAVRRASLQAINMIIAAGEIRRTEGLLAETRAGSLPLLTGNASYMRLDSPRGPPAAPFIPQDQFDANAALQLPIVAPSKWVAWSHASEQVDVSRANEAEVRRTTVLTAARAYLAILTQKRIIDVSRSAREIAQARYDFAHARLAGGIGNAVDEFRARQQLASAEAQLAAGEVGLVRAQEALGVITGGDRPLDASEEPNFQPAPVTDPIATAESQRLDAKAARARADVVEHIARDTWVEWLPTLLASAQAFYNAPPAITTPRTGWQVQFLLSIPIYEGGYRHGLQNERNAAADEQRVALEGTLLQVRSDVRLAFEEVRKQEVALAQARLAANSARSALELTVEAYRAGATTDLDVSTAQQQSRDADLAAVIAEDGVRQARLDLVAAIGQFP